MKSKFTNLVVSVLVVAHVAQGLTVDASDEQNRMSTTGPQASTTTRPSPTTTPTTDMPSAISTTGPQASTPTTTPTTDMPSAISTTGPQASTPTRPFPTTTPTTDMPNDISTYGPVPQPPSPPTSPSTPTRPSRPTRPAPPPPISCTDRCYGYSSSSGCELCLSCSSECDVDSDRKSRQQCVGGFCVLVYEYDCSCSCPRSYEGSCRE